MATRSKKILICDTDEKTRESLKLILSDHYDLILTDSPEQAIECLNRDTTIALALLAAQMPKVGGKQTLEAIKEEKPLLEVLLVNTPESSEIPSGACGVIRKPFNTKAILDQVREKMG